MAGWQLSLVTTLREAIDADGPFDEAINWHAPIFIGDGPCMLIHSEESCVLLAFWRGKRLVTLDARVRPSGKYELGNITFREGTPVDAALITGLAGAARDLNRQRGDPTAIR